jgi:hypothetical protein
MQMQGYQRNYEFKCIFTGKTIQGTNWRKDLAIISLFLLFSKLKE